MERHVADRIIRQAFNGPPGPVSYSGRLQVYASGYDTDPVYLEDDEAGYVAAVFAEPWCAMCEDFIEEGQQMLTVRRKSRPGTVWTYCEPHASEQGYGRTSDA